MQGSYSKHRFTLAIENEVVNSDANIHFDSLFCDASPDPVVLLTNLLPNIRYDCWVGDDKMASALTDDDSPIKFTVAKEVFSRGRNAMMITARNTCTQVEQRKFYIQKIDTLDRPIVTESNGTLYTSHPAGDWYFNEQKVSENTSSFRPTTSGIYKHEININGCLASTPFDFIFQENGWQYFPIPAISRVTITAPEGSTIKYIHIVAPSGMMVSRLNLEHAVDQIVVDLEDLAEGIYLAVIGTEKDFQTLRIVKTEKVK
jgi:hypothetical protein